jgi:uncharacterized protein DUF6519
MKGDFSRFTFDPARHFTRVLMQQGRVQLDSDFNEQVDILWHYLRTLATDLIGPYGGPNSDQLGFKITGKLGSSTPPALEDLIIGFGRYYVDGILCENTPAGALPGDYRRAGLVRMDYDSASDRDMDEMDEMSEAKTLKAGQPGVTAQQQGGLSFYGQSGERLSIEEARSRYGELKPPFFVFLDVWERSVSAIEEPEILEAALGGQDTAARSQVVWQVRAASMEGMTSPEKLDCKDLDDEVFLDFWNKVTNKVPPEKRGRLSAKAREPLADESTDPCIISPDARYRGAENQLYRVEIHTGGVINASPPPTFKWSRDNGSNIYPVLTIKDKTVFLEHLGRDGRSGLQAGDWVEIVDDDYTLRGKAQPLSQVDSVDAIEMSITLKTAPHAISTGKHPLLRRWDQRASGQKNSGLKINDDDNAVLLKAGGLNLEDGIQVYFEEGRTYVAGDYWLIPARTATGDIQWPRGEDAMLPPQGVEHHYAPLAGVFLLPSGPARKGGLYVTDYRFRFDPLAECSDRVIGSPE